MTTQALTPTAAGLPAKSRAVPGPKGCVVFGSLSEFRKDALAFVSNSARDYGDVVRLELVKPAFLVTHPDAVKHVLQDNHVNYKKNFIYERLTSLVGDGLLTLNGEEWKRHRRLAQPAFHRQRLAGFAELMVKHTRRMLERWEKDGGPLDVHAEMMKLTLVIVGDALFSVDLEQDAADVGRALTTALEITNDRFQSLLLVPQAIPTPQNRRFKEAMGVLDGMVNGIIEERRRSGKHGDDLLGMLMAARDEETGSALTDLELRNEVMTMVLAGHETTANALSWAFYLLSMNPSVERKLHEEVTRVLGGRAPALSDLPQLKYTQQVMDEAMRLYPPIWSIAREAIDDDEIGGFHIPKGSNVLLAQWVTHRHPQFWENPEGFDPERFASDKTAARHRGAYFPFAAGPRQCIGNNFALMEMPIILAMVNQAWQLHRVPGHRVDPDPTVTLRPSDGVKVTLHAQA